MRPAVRVPHAVGGGSIHEKRNKTEDSGTASCQSRFKCKAHLTLLLVSKVSIYLRSDEYQIMDSPQLAAKIPTDPGKALPRNERRGSVLRREALERIQQVKGGPYQNEGTNLARGEAADAGASNDFGAQGVQSVEGLVLHQNRRDIRHAPEPTGEPDAGSCCWATTLAQAELVWFERFKSGSGRTSNISARCASGTPVTPMSQVGLLHVADAMISLVQVRESSHGRMLLFYSQKKVYLTG